MKKFNSYVENLFCPCYVLFTIRSNARARTSWKENEEEEGVNGTAQPTTSSCLEEPIVSPALCPRQRVWAVRPMGITRRPRQDDEWMDAAGCGPGQSRRSAHVSLLVWCQCHVLLLPSRRGRLHGATVVVGALGFGREGRRRMAHEASRSGASC